MASRSTPAEPAENPSKVRALAPPERGATAANRRLLTADEIPMPPAEMRLPPSTEEETLFDMAGVEEPGAD